MFLSDFLIKGTLFQNVFLLSSKNGKLYDYGRSPRQRSGGDVKMANQMALPASNNTHAKPDDEKAILCMGRMND